MSIPLNNVESILNQMNPIYLNEINQISLMDRVDFKYIAPISILPRLLEEMIPHFKVQEINGKRISPYCTQYLDTPELHFFLTHQNGKRTRQKIRIRSYIDSSLSFLEVKNKNNKGRTNKIRIPVPVSHIQSVEDLDDHKEFLEKNAAVDNQFLQPVLENEFKRITLINNKATERVTLDFDLSFSNYQTERQENVPNLLILELKQEGWQHSDSRDIVHLLRIKKVSISKYCMGTALTNPCVKYNLFKKKWIFINKLIR
jgi:hypothetical protein